MTEENDGGSQTAMTQKVAEVIERVRPYLQRDGGDVELVNVNEEEGIVFVRLQGACSGCPSSSMTLQMGIKKELQASVPEVKEVIPVD